MDKKFNIGIIGAGIVAERIINASMDHPRTKIKGIYDRDIDRLLEVTRKYWLDGYSSYEELLDDSEIDIIYLAVPPKYHYPLGVDTFKSGKHFLCEKPLANSMEEAKTMAKLSNDKDVVYAMNFPTIYGSPYKKIKELLDKGSIGKLLRLEFQGYFTDWPRPWQKNPWIVTREQGGFTKEVITHYVHLMQRLFGDIEQIHSFVNYPTDTYRAEKSLIAKCNIRDIEVLINCVTDIGMKEKLSFNMIGTKGTISLKNWNEVWVSKKDSEFEKIELEKIDPSKNLLDNLFSAIDRDESDIVDFKEGCKTHIVIEKLLGN